MTLFSLFFVVGCSNTKYLPEGDLLYTGGSVTIKDSIMKKKNRKALEKELEGLLRPKPNKQIFGLRPKLLIYNLAGEPTKDKGFRYWLRNKVGQPPVLFSQVDLAYNESILQNYAENKGYFNAKAQGDTLSKNKKAEVHYVLQPQKRYYINQINFPKDTSFPLASKMRNASRSCACEPKQINKQITRYFICQR